MGTYQILFVASFDTAAGTVERELSGTLPENEQTLSQKICGASAEFLAGINRDFNGPVVQFYSVEIIKDQEKRDD